jgi:RNA polymerase sigma-70 factor (ECF subfamily)
MKGSSDQDTQQLLEQARQGDLEARQRLLSCHRKRLRQMIALRMDRRIAARVDPSDVVQEALIEALRRLPDYMHRCPLPFYPWLRQLALDQLADLHRRHIRTQRRSVKREEHWLPALSDESALELAGRLFSSGSSPSAALRREELQARARAALGRLPPRDQELLVLRHLEHLSPREIAAVLGITEGAVYTRHVRALERLRNLLGDEFAEEAP